MRPERAGLLAASLFAATAAAAGEVPEALVVLEVLVRALPHHVPEAAPARFALLEDGQVFVGGTSAIAAGRLGSRELKDLDRRLAEVRKLAALAGSVTIGPGDERRRLFLGKGRPLTMALTGDPAQPPLGLAPLARLVADLERFHHPSLRPYQPRAFALSAREGSAPGGCRSWPFDSPPSANVFAPRIVPAAPAADWPVGAAPASVCADEQRYLVTLRPLLPGEKP